MASIPTPEEFKRLFEESAEAQKRTAYQSVAQQLILRSEVQALLETVQKLSDALSAIGGKTDSVRESFSVRRKELIQQALFLIEDEDSEIAALLQKELNEAGE